MFQIEFALLNEGCKLKKANNLGDSLAVELAALTRAALVQIQVPQPLTLISMYRAVGSLPAVAKTPVAGFTPR